MRFLLTLDLYVHTIRLSNCVRILQNIEHDSAGNASSQLRLESFPSQAACIMVQLAASYSIALSL